MKLKTKFNIEDNVFTVHKSHGKCVCCKSNYSYLTVAKRKVSVITIEVSKTKGDPMIVYCLNPNYISRNEDHVFKRNKDASKTIEEAQSSSKYCKACYDHIKKLLESKDE